MGLLENHKTSGNHNFFPKLFCEEKMLQCSRIFFFLKFEAEDQEFANFLRSLEQFIQMVKGQNNFW